MKYVYIALGLVLFGVVGHLDYTTQLRERASQVCQQQTPYTVPTYAQCLANQKGE